jgi:hypothetical protein
MLGMGTQAALQKARETPLAQQAGTSWGWYGEHTHTHIYIYVYIYIVINIHIHFY